MFPHTITIFNKWLNSTTKEEEYHKTIIRNVSWTELKGANMIKGGYESSDNYIVVIPFSSTEDKYITPKEYQKLSKEDSQGFFTLQVGDKIVKGEITEEYISMVQLEKNFDGVMTVTAVRDNKDVAINPYLNHIEVGGK